MPVITAEALDTILDTMTLNQVEDQYPAQTTPTEVTLTNAQVKKIVNWLQKMPENNGYHGVRRRFFDYYGFKVPLETVILIDERRQARIAELVAPPIQPVGG